MRSLWCVGDGAEAPARAGRAGKAQRLRSAGSGDGKWWGVSKVVHPHPWLAHGRTRASHSRRPVSATEISIRSRKSGRDPLPMVPDPRHRESEKTMDDGMRKTSNP